MASEIFVTDPVLIVQLKVFTGRGKTKTNQTKPKSKPKNMGSKKEERKVLGMVEGRGGFLHHPE